MSVSKIYTAQPGILSGEIITVEVDISRGLHSFTTVGLAGKAVEESKDRVNSAVKNSSFKAPKSRNEKVTVSLSPADLKKEGPLFDLPIAIAYLMAAGQTKGTVDKTVFIGELALDGSVKPVRGVLPAVESAARAGFLFAVVPEENKEEAALVSNITILPTKNLLDVIKHIDTTDEDYKPLPTQKATKIPNHWHGGKVSLEDIKGQESAKRGLIIAAAGRHNVIMVGPPGTGKTMLARAFQTLLPPLSQKEALEVTSIHSLSGQLGNISTAPPFRSPHHTASHTSLVGGGTHPKPGEVTLAHNGVLFMDEFPEFERRSLDALRQPLEDRVVSISRVQGTAKFPADFILVAAMNPYRGSEDGTTDYVAAMNDSYRGKVSGPILDRIDLWLNVPHVDYETLTKTEKKTGETDLAQKQIAKARELQSTRLKNKSANTNATMSARELEETTVLTDDVKELLKQSSIKFNLSPRSYHRVIKVARTIADLDGKENIETSHILEALQYRVKL